ncbi:MAG: hypothetical protein Phog2KO_34220 [Phototrophicaceae bacterium]
MTLRLDVTTTPAKADIAILRLGLSSYNVAQVPELMQLAEDEFLVVMHEDGNIVAGAVCEFDWGCLYFDTVWTDESVRGKGYGTLIMDAAESYATQKGIQQAYLMTTSFQARPFYEKLGYERFGFQEDRPRGHIFHFMRKTQLSEKSVDKRITIESPPTREAMKILDDGLLDEIAKTEPLIMQRLAIFLRDEEDNILGGMIGGSFWDWFDMRVLWLDDSVRGQGWAKKILTLTEAYTRDNNLIGICCDTASFQALAFYQSQGFEIMASLDNRPPQHQSHFLQKRLD